MFGDGENIELCPHSSRTNINIDININIKGICSVMDIIRGNGHGKPSSNPGQSFLLYISISFSFFFIFKKKEKYTSISLPLRS